MSTVGARAYLGRTLLSGFTALLAACATPSPEQAPSALSSFARKAEQVALGCSAIPGLNVVTFEDADTFDCRLHKGLASVAANNGSELLVKFPEDAAVSATQPPARLDPWIVRIQESSGKIATCQTDQSQSVGQIAVWIVELGKALWPEVKALRLYGPAKDFDLRIEVNRTNYIHQLRFIRKPSATNLFASGECKVGIG